MRVFCRWVINLVCWKEHHKLRKTSNLNFDSVPNACNVRSNGNMAANEGALNATIYSPSYLNAENDLSSGNDNVGLMDIIHFINNSSSGCEIYYLVSWRKIT